MPRLTQAPAADPSSDDDAPRPTTRRAFVAGALAAATLAPSTLRAQGRRNPKAQRETLSPEPPGAILPANVVSAPTDWTSPIARLVRRATIGITDDEMVTARALGYQGYLTRQLDYQRLDNTAVEAAVNSLWPYLSQEGTQIYNINLGTLVQQLQASWIYRATRSPRQLYERMVEFWSDHFNIDMLKVGYLKVLDDREVIRRHAMGKFPDLLKASAHSPAMLAYLDQNVSRVGAPNQNYARELLELHTVGVDGGYTQTDVDELARVLTGWTLQGRGNFVFNPALHDWGAKTVMGITIPAGSPAVGADGIREGEQILEYLVNHPSTARFIATKMLRWLLTPEPTATQITAIASVYRATKGDIRLMVRAILNEGWVSAAPLKYKRPFHFLVSALRSSKAVITNTQSMNAQMNALGQPLHLFETPDGYPDVVEYWGGNVMPRWSFGSLLSTQRTGQIAIDSAPYLAGTPDAAIDLVNARFFGSEMGMTTRTALLNYLRGGTFNDTRVREVISLAVGAEDFQWC